MARAFGGSSANYINFGSSVPNMGSTAWSMGCWFQYFTTGTQQSLIARNDGGFAGQIYIYLNGDNVRVDIPFVVGNVLVSSSTISDSNWHSLVVTRSANSWVMYIDGTSAATATNSNTPATGQSLILGQLPSFESDGWNGPMAEVFQSSSVWSTTQVSQFAAGARAITVDATNLVFYAPLLGNTAPEPDLSGNGNNGVLNGTLTSASDPGALTALKTVFYTSTGNITLPSDFTATNVVYGIGESGNAAGGTTLVTGGGAGAGASAWLENYSAHVAGATVAVTVGTGGTGVKTIFDTGNNSLVADFGTSASGATAGAGGLTANSTGTQKYAGGNGGAGATTAGGSGGGAAGPIGAGGNAAASSTVTSGNGGTANGGSQAGGVGVGTTNPGNPGIAQSPAPWTATAGGTAAPSAGASGAGGLTLAAESGGAAVAYGGAPGGGDLVSSGTSTGGAPSHGIIVLTYVAGSGAAVTIPWPFFARVAA